MVTQGGLIFWMMLQGPVAATKSRFLNTMERVAGTKVWRHVPGICDVSCRAY